MKVLAMRTGSTRTGGVFGPHAHGNVGRQVTGDQDKTQRVEQLAVTHTETR